jgi:sterol desaturase/sphingolipid hydroxylase (fatty acid hydroxylase superfamily)
MQNEGTIRLSIFLGVLVAMACWEIAVPRRALSQSKWRRWGSNLGIVVLDTLVVRVMFPVLAVGAAVWAEQKGWGLFNLLQLPGWLEVAVAAILLDMVVYWQHRLFHVIPLFWRMHRMHHADLDFDVTTALRFHPFEIILSMVIKLLAVLILGPAAMAVLIFEVLLNGTAMFNHGNVRLAPDLDRWLRLLVVTPDMHRVHHSIEAREYNSNFGFNLPWWDRLFGSYQDQPAAGHSGMRIGLRTYSGRICANLIWMLVLPFKPLQMGSGPEPRGNEDDQG